ncbi:hypothetical protein WJX77_002712 [Trebouxia sp. C0004]
MTRWTQCLEAEGLSVQMVKTGAGSKSLIIPASQKAGTSLTWRTQLKSLRWDNVQALAFGDLKIRSSIMLQLPKMKNST